MGFLSTDQAWGGQLGSPLELDSLERHNDGDLAPAPLPLENMGQKSTLWIRSDFAILEKPTAL